MQLRLIYNRLFSIGLFGALFLITSQPASAVTVLSPVVTLQGRGGETLNGVVKVFNETAETVYLAGSVEPYGDTRVSHDYISWFTLGEKSIVVQPQQAMVVPFRVTIPNDTAPGGYYATIFWQSAPGPARGQVGLTAKVGTTVLLTVDGTLDQRLALASFRATVTRGALASFSAVIENQGNVHAQPFGTVTVRDWLGNERTWTVNQDRRPLLPGVSRQYDVVARPTNESWLSGLRREMTSWSIGPATIILVLRDDTNADFSATAQATAWLMPYYSLITLSGFIFVGLLLFISRRRIVVKSS